MRDAIRLGAVMGLLSLGACVRWGLPEDEGFNDESTDEVTSAMMTTDDTTETGDEAWPEAWVIDPDARVVVWGKTGIPTKNLEMFENVFSYLGGDADGELALLWISSCDPRVDPEGCLAGNVQPFFSMVDGIGTIAFTPLANVDPLAYDVVIADFCAELTPAQVRAMLEQGANVLVLADDWCESAAGVSADVANELLEHLGVRFNEHLLYNHEFLIAADKQLGLLEGVPLLDAWGVALQDVGPGFASVVGTIDGAAITTIE